MCSYEQLFNCFGAAGIPNTYEATLWKSGKRVKSRTFHRRRSAENQCLRWIELHQAVFVP